MIAFGCSITEPEPYLRATRNRASASPPSRIRSSSRSPRWERSGRSYNLLLDAAAAHDDLEALVLVHPAHRDRRSGRAARSSGGVRRSGGRGGRMRWRDRGALDRLVGGRSQRAAHVIHRYLEHGGGELPAFSWTERSQASGRGRHRRRVPARAVAMGGAQSSLRRGPVFGHGFELDYLPAGRAAGRKVMIADLPVIRASLAGSRERPGAMGRGPHPAGHASGTVGCRGSRAARRLEGRAPAARRPSARLPVRSPIPASTGCDAAIEELQRALEQATGTLSWRADRRRCGGSTRSYGTPGPDARARAADGVRPRRSGPGLVRERAADLFARDHRLVGRDTGSDAQP